MIGVVTRGARSATAAVWLTADRSMTWATSPVGRSARLRTVTLSTWIAAYAAMSVVDFVRVGGPTRWVLIVPTAAATLAAAIIWRAAWHPRSQVRTQVVHQRRRRAQLVAGGAPHLAGLAEAVDRHRVASSTAPRRIRRAQRAQVAELVVEVSGLVAAAQAVDLVRVDEHDDVVRAAPGCERAHDDLVAVAAHRARCIDALTAESLASALDGRLAVAGHLDQVAVAARLAAQRQVDAAGAAGAAGAAPHDTAQLRCGMRQP